MRLPGWRIASLASVLGLLAFGAPASAGDACTDGVDCYCDRVADPGSAEYDPGLIWCEDFEDAAFHDDVPGAWYTNLNGIPGSRGGGSLWLQRYKNTGNKGEWRNGQPASPQRGDTCAYNVCGPAEWRADDLWDGNYTAVIDVQRQGEVDDEIAGLTLNGVPEGRQYMAWRLPAGNTSGIHGNVSFASATELGFTAAMAYSTNLLSATGATGDFVPFPWKHLEWGDSLGTLFMGNVGGGGAPFSPALFKNPSTSQAECTNLLAQATFEAGSASCTELGVRIASNFSRAAEWPLGTWGCVRGHIKGMGSTNGSLEIWFNDKKVFSMTNANLRDLFQDQSIDWFVLNSYYNGNAGYPIGTPATQTFYRYTDANHLRRGAPVSCNAIGLGDGSPASPPPPPAGDQRPQRPVLLD